LSVTERTVDVIVIRIYACEFLFMGKWNTISQG
jgi:hypothetical protein